MPADGMDVWSDSLRSDDSPTGGEQNYRFGDPVWKVRTCYHAIPSSRHPNKVTATHESSTECWMKVIFTCGGSSHPAPARHHSSRVLGFSCPPPILSPPPPPPPASLPPSSSSPCTCLSLFQCLQQSSPLRRWHGFQHFGRRSHYRLLVKRGGRGGEVEVRRKENEIVVVPRCVLAADCSRVKLRRPPLRNVFRLGVVSWSVFPLKTHPDPSFSLSQFKKTQTCCIFGRDDPQRHDSRVLQGDPGPFPPPLVRPASPWNQESERWSSCERPTTDGRSRGPDLGVGSWLDALLGLLLYATLVVSSHFPKWIPPPAISRDSALDPAAGCNPDSYIPCHRKSLWALITM